MNNMNQNGRSMIEMLGVLAIIGVLSVGGIAGYSKAMLKYKTNKTIDGVTMLTTNIRTLYAQQKTFNGLDGRKIKDTSGTLSLDGSYDKGKAAINMGVVPNELDKSTYENGAIKGDAVLQNPFAGSITITLDNSVPGNAGVGRAFIIGVDGIPKEACMAIATSDWGSNYSSGLIGMAIEHAYDGTAAKAASADLNGDSTDKAYAGADCGASKNTGNLGTGDTGADHGAICAAHMPLKVAEAAKACACDGSQCSVAFKYY